MSVMRSACFAHLILHLITLIIFCEEYTQIMKFLIMQIFPTFWGSLQIRVICTVYMAHVTPFLCILHVSVPLIDCESFHRLKNLNVFDFSGCWRTFLLCVRLWTLRVKLFFPDSNSPRAIIITLCDSKEKYLFILKRPCKCLLYSHYVLQGTALWTGICLFIKPTVFNLFI
jgi:hypothetical protein